MEMREKDGGPKDAFCFRFFREGKKKKRMYVFVIMINQSNRLIHPTTFKCFPRDQKKEIQQSTHMQVCYIDTNTTPQRAPPHTHKDKTRTDDVINNPRYQSSINEIE